MLGYSLSAFPIYNFSANIITTPLNSFSCSKDSCHKLMVIFFNNKGAYICKNHERGYRQEPGYGTFRL